MKDVSVIIPAYNVEKYIGELLDSLYNQTYKEFELIVIDDGSTDNTNQILQQYKEEKLKDMIIYKQENKGQSSARNKGISLSTGNYLMFIDSDDLIEYDYIERLYKEAIYSDADIVVCGYNEIDSKGFIEINKFYCEDWNIDFDNGESHLFQYLSYAKIYKKSFWNEYNMKYSEGEQFEDIPLCIMQNVLSKKTTLIRNYIGYHYRIHHNSTMGKSRKKKSKPNIAYRGFENTIDLLYKMNLSKEKYDVVEYAFTKSFAGLLTLILKNAHDDCRKEFCQFTYKIMDKYFVHVNKNPYIKINKIKKLPIVHRVATYLFVKAYKMRILYLFSKISSKFI